MACGHRVEFRSEFENSARVGFNETYEYTKPPTGWRGEASPDNSMVIRESKGSEPLMGYDFFSSSLEKKGNEVTRRADNRVAAARTPPLASILIGREHDSRRIQIFPFPAAGKY